MNVLIYLSLSLRKIGHSLEPTELLVCSNSIRLIHAIPNASLKDLENGVPWPIQIEI